LLRDPRSGVSFALIQGGTTSESESPEIESLGTLFYEPLWTFHRSELRGLGCRKISIGPDGSGTRALSLELLKRSSIDVNNLALLGYSPLEASEKLLSGEIDAVFMLHSWESPVVHLLADDRVELASFPITDAYVAHYPYLNKVVVPAGVADLKQRPPMT